MKKVNLALVFLMILISVNTVNADYRILIDHTSTNLSQIPEAVIDQAKSDLHIVYQHTSHGSQLITGMNVIETYPDFGNKYEWSDSGSSGLDLDDRGIPGIADLSQGDSVDINGDTPWVISTRALLDNPANNHVNVVVWSWCSINGHDAQRYVDNMEKLVSEYPSVYFVFMTGHAEGQGEDLTPNRVHYNNQLIRAHCFTNNRILYDFADIEAYNPGNPNTPDSPGYEYLWDQNMYDNLNYTDGNWGTEWIALYPNSELARLTTGDGVAGYSGCSGCAHSDSPPAANLNCVLKGRAAWWLWAKIAALETPLPGDIDQDYTVNLIDALLALQLMVGINPAHAIYKTADVNGDDKVGIEEAVYILRKIAGLEAPSEGVIKSTASYNLDPSYSASDMTAMIAGFSEFTVDFYHSLANDTSMAGENLFFSAYSIENALAMTWAGAKNQTANEMAGTLHLNLPQNQFHPTLNALNIDINSRDDEQPPSGDPFALNLVNAIWSRVGYPFLPDYLDIIAKDYDAGIRTLDFMSNPEGSRQIINQWVEDQTNEKIKDLLPPDSISPLTAVVLTNAIYFKGSWHEKFDLEKTAPGPFTLLDGTVVTAELMSRQKDSRYFRSNGFDVVELPYASPKFPEYAYPQELAMLVIIPNSDEFESVEGSLNKGRIDAIIDSLSMGTVKLTFPKFEFECETTCKDILKGLGMVDAFDSSLADFSGMVSPINSKPWIDEIYHKAFVAVDETGTEAAAATAVVMTDTAMPEIVTISVDKPFVFVIYDHFTNTILFMGRVLDPTA